jgi:hypothetical protein
VVGAPAGTRVEIRTLQGALIAAGEAGAETRFALPANAIYAVKLSRGGDSRTLLR